MVAQVVDGIDLFKIANRSISGWVPSYKAGSVSHTRQPFCSQLEERLMLWLEYNPQVTRYARGDIGREFATTYRLPMPSDAPFSIGYTFDSTRRQRCCVLWEQAVAQSGVPQYLGSPDDLKLLLMKAVNRKTLHHGYHVQNSNRLSFQGRWYVCPGLLSRLRGREFDVYYDRRDVGVLYIFVEGEYGGAATMTHSLFRKEFFVETAFERRFQAMLRLAWQHRSWHVIVADPGAGKTIDIRDLVRAAGARAILAVTAPKNNEDGMALGNQFFSALGVPIKGRWCDRKPKLMAHMHQYDSECLIVDDAHDLSFKHLMFLKELTDQGRLQYDHPFGLCLVAAACGSVIPLKETLDQPETTWLQWRRRLDKVQPFCRVTSHTSEEVRAILASLETVYQELIPQLNLRRWSNSIYTWLTQPVLDPANSGRVTMDYLMKLVTTALEWTYQAREADVRAETLEQAASLLVLRKDTLWIIDGAGPGCDSPLSGTKEQGNGNGTQAKQEMARTDVSSHLMETSWPQICTSRLLHSYRTLCRLSS
jgi:hypothetical protein